jgi:DNA-binding LacI/PurR family transcriptional regulator
MPGDLGSRLLLTGPRRASEEHVFLEGNFRGKRHTKNPFKKSLNILFRDEYSRTVRVASPSKTKLECAFQNLQQRILEGTWKCGERIPTEAELALELGLSQGTVNKALARLAHDGLVERKRCGGTRVLRNSPRHERPRPQLDAVAFVYPSEQHEGIRRIVQGFQEAAHAVERRVVMLSTGTDYHKEGEIIGRLDEFDVKGAVVCPVLPNPEDRLYFAQMLLTCRFPVVLADMTLPGFSGHSVTVDAIHAGWTMTRHLLGQGLKRIGYLSNYAWLPSVRENYLGYRRAMEEADISIRPEWVGLDPCIQLNLQDPLAEGAAAARQFLQSAVEEGLEGVVCGNDFQALVVLASARELGISVPDQFKVTGIADYAISAQSNPPLTTYHVPYEEIGRQSFQMLTRLLQGEKPAESEVQLRGSLIVRQSG